MKYASFILRMSKTIQVKTVTSSLKNLSNQLQKFVHYLLFYCIYYHVQMKLYRTYYIECTCIIGVQVIIFNSIFFGKDILLLSATIPILQKFWRLLFHNAWSCSFQILPNCSFTVSKKSVIHKVIIYCISKVFCSQHTAEKLQIFT